MGTRQCGRDGAVGGASEGVATNKPPSNAVLCCLGILLSENVQGVMASVSP